MEKTVLLAFIVNVWNPCLSNNPATASVIFHYINLVGNSQVAHLWSNLKQHLRSSKRTLIYKILSGQTKCTSLLTSLTSTAFCYDLWWDTLSRIDHKFVAGGIMVLIGINNHSLCCGVIAEISSTMQNRSWDSKLLIYKGYKRVLISRSMLITILKRQLFSRSVINFFYNNVACLVCRHWFQGKIIKYCL